MVIEPVFLEGFAHGARFALWVSPEAGSPSKGSILCIQPFGDEATLARRVLVAQACRLAGLGWTTLIVDPFGTGDSAGETGEATLDHWRADLLHAARIARERAPGAFVLWGTRMGALLACDLLPALDQLVSATMFWQPAPTGAGLLEPLLKLAKVGAVARSGEAEGSVEVAAGVASGGGAGAAADVGAAADGSATSDAPPAFEPAASVNLGGYLLRHDLVDGLSALAMRPAPVAPRAAPRPVLMLGVQRVLRANAVAPLWLAGLAQEWLDAGYLGNLRTVQGEPFWASLEPSTPVAAFEATEAFLRGVVEQ